MRERPILFSAPMVRAILDGRKTQTRRVVKQPKKWAGKYDQLCTKTMLNTFMVWWWNGVNGLVGASQECPYGQPGDRLWVRETHAIVPRTAYRCSEGVQQTLRPDDEHDAAVFREGWERSPPGRWRPSIHMPRWASRITLEVTGVRVERLNAISEADALAEGIDPEAPDECAIAFQRLWESINGPGSWDANPFVWVVEFKRLEAPHA